MSDTPRTDAHSWHDKDYDDPIHAFYDFAKQLERELNAANSRIQLLMSANADVARIAGERDAAEKRIRLLIAERDKYQERIKRLEEAGDALKAAGYFGGFGDAVNKWVKIREAKP